MSLAKIKTKWNMVALGVGTVVGDYNGNVLSETEANEFGDAKLKFKIVGGYKLSEKVNENGQKEWLTQSLWCSIEKNHPLVPIVNSLSAGDSVFVFGKLRKSSYRNFRTNRVHRNAFCNIEHIAIISHGNGELAKEPKGAVAVDVADEIDDLDF